MSKMKRADGAPSYIQLFTTMMIVLLAFFIVLTTLSKDQDAGFREGIGEVKDAFGIAGGIGIMPFHFSESGIADDDPGPERRKTAPKDAGISRRLMRGGGGVGISSLTYDPGKPTFLRIRIQPEFAPGSAALPPDLVAFLDLAGTVLASQTSYHFALRQVTTETGDWQADSTLAQRRAVAVMRFLHRSCMMQAHRITAVGYAAPRWLEDNGQLGLSENKQLLVLDLYRPGDTSAADLHHEALED